MIGSGSWLDIAATLGALVDAEGRTVLANLTHEGMDHVIMSCDLGKFRDQDRAAPG